jgi:hypothetical protein
MDQFLPKGINFDNISAGDKKLAKVKGKRKAHMLFEQSKALWVLMFKIL